MLKRIFFLLFIYISGFSNLTLADEGMWLPLLLKKLNEADMQKEGLKLNAEDIYNINHSSLKDAIVRLGAGFCTGEMISGDGLMLTNHHCAFESIQDNSSVGNDILTNGFWAKVRDNELPNPGLSVDFLVRIEDVSQRIKDEVIDTLSESVRAAALQRVFAKIIKEAADSNNYKAEVKSFLKGNEFYLFIYQTFPDVRLVGAPPSSIGKFGGDSDNWIWPRHTGDFALFRVYSSKDGKPAAYSRDNIPYHPKKYLPVSLDGYKKDDFAMTIGYPGTTDRYLTSEGVKQAIEITSPAIIKIREKKLALLKERMNLSDSIRIKYSSKYYTSSNYYKYYIGQRKGLIRMNVVQRKQDDEKKFQEWAVADPVRNARYGHLMEDFRNNYAILGKYALSRQYFNEAVFQGAEVFLQSYRFRALAGVLESKTKSALTEKQKAIIDDLKAESIKYFKDYDEQTDMNLYAGLLKLYDEEVPKKDQPAIFREIEREFNNNFSKYAAAVYKQTIFADSTKFNAFLNAPSLKKLEKDPVYQAMSSLLDNYLTKIIPFTRMAEQANATAYRLYLEGLQQMHPEKKFYSDANATMRLSYGKVEDYIPMDATHYNYYTTIEGIMQKQDNNQPDYVVPVKLSELFKQKDYGRYGENGTLPVCFITTNDITGGNSGSPVINGNGELIGVAFDGNWEAMSGEIAFDAEYKRCINVDIRYVLFIIDKFAGASSLIDEMKMVSKTRTEN